MATSKRKNIKKPSKPYPSYPLTAHNNGQWCKKIRGKIHFFGVWGDTQTALEKYLAVAAALHTGRQPSSENLHLDEVTVKDISNQYLTYQCEKVKTNDLRPRTFAEYRNIIECFAKFIGSTRTVSTITPLDFQRFRNKLTQKGLQNKNHGWVFTLLAEISRCFEACSNTPMRWI